MVVDKDNEADKDTDNRTIKKLTSSKKKLLEIRLSSKASKILLSIKNQLKI